MEKIQTHFNLTPSHGSYTSPRLVGLDPKKGIKGSWERYFTPMDEEYFNDVVHTYTVIKNLNYIGD